MEGVYADIDSLEFLLGKVIWQKGSSRDYYVGVTFEGVYFDHEKNKIDPYRKATEKPINEEKKEAINQKDDELINIEDQDFVSSVAIEDEVVIEEVFIDDEDQTQNNSRSGLIYFLLILFAVLGGLLVFLSKKRAKLKTITEEIQPRTSVEEYILRKKNEQDFNRN